MKFIFRRVSKNRKIYYPDGCKKIYCQKNTVAQKYAKKNKVAVEITGTKRTQQNYVAQKLLLKKNAVTLKPDSSYRVEAEMVPFYASKQELAYSKEQTGNCSSK